MTLLETNFWYCGLWPDYSILKNFNSMIAGPRLCIIIIIIIIILIFRLLGGGIWILNVYDKNTRSCQLVELPCSFFFFFLFFALKGISLQTESTKQRLQRVTNYRQHDLTTFTKKKKKKHDLTTTATNTSNYTITPQRLRHSNKTNTTIGKDITHTETSDSQISASLVYTTHWSRWGKSQWVPKIALRQKRRTGVIENFTLRLICSFLCQQVSTPISFPPNVISFDHPRLL